MSEARVVAQELEPVVPGVFHWRISNPNIGGGWSSSHAVRTDDGESVLIDPVRLVDQALAELEPVNAIVLTAATHQRSAWRYRKRFGVPVYLPEGSRETEEEPDVHYGAGDFLPGGLRAIHAPGPEDPHYALLRSGPPAVLFCPDLLMVEGGELAFVPGEYHEDPDETVRSVEGLLDVPFDILCLDHGPPLVSEPKETLRELLSTTKGG